jgi:hypothetical protein
MSRPLEVLLRQKRQLEDLMRIQQLKLESEKNAGEQEKLRDAIRTTQDKIENIRSQIEAKQAHK